VCRRTIPIPQRSPLVETSAYLLQDNRTVSQLKTRCLEVAKPLHRERKVLTNLTVTKSPRAL